MLEWGKNQHLDHNSLVVGVYGVLRGFYSHNKINTRNWHSPKQLPRKVEQTDAKEQHGNPDDWHDWDADTADDAIETVDYFEDKGMRKEGVGYGGGILFIFFSVVLHKKN